MFLLPYVASGQIIDSTLEPCILEKLVLGEDTFCYPLRTVKGFEVEMRHARVVNKKGQKVLNGFDKYYIHVIKVEFKNFRVQYKYKDTLRSSGLSYELVDSAKLNVRDTVILSAKDRRKAAKKARQDSLRAKMKADSVTKDSINLLMRKVETDTVKLKEQARLKAEKDSIDKAKAQAKEKRKKNKMKRVKNEPAKADSSEKGKAYAYIAIASFDPRIPKVDTFLKSKALMVVGLVENSASMMNYIKRKILITSHLVDSLKETLPEKTKAIEQDTLHPEHKKDKIKELKDQLTEAKLLLKQEKEDLAFYQEFNRNSTNNRIVTYFLSQYFLDRNLKYNAVSSAFGLPEIKYNAAKYGKLTPIRMVVEFFKELGGIFKKKMP